MKVDFNLEIHRSHGGQHDRPIYVRVEDFTSGCRILEVNFGLAEFMEILTGLGGIHAEGDFYEDSPVGCTREHKEEMVPKPSGYERNQEEAAKILALFEVDGWVARTDDIFNHHRWAKDKVRVSFTRYIRPDGSVWSKP